MKNILVTGAAGFIGSHVCEQLLEEGNSVVGLDNVNDYYSVAYKEENLSILAKYQNFRFVKGDFSNQDLVRNIFKQNRLTHVAHLGARAGVRPSIKDPLLYLDSNAKGTLVLLEAARDNDIENFVLTSSSSVYGNSKAIPFKEDDSATDKPISQYAATKKATEVMGHTYHYLYGLNINIVRPFTVFGPRGRPDMAPWLFLDATLKGKPIKRYGDGTSRRDYTYINDFVGGFVNAIYRPFGFDIFNLGNSNTVSLNEALKTVAEVCGKDQIITEMPAQPGDVEITNADISKAKTLLSYNPTTSFKDGMKEFHQWFVANKK